MSGPKIAALYGLIPNQLGFCGPQQNLLRKFIAGKLMIPEIVPVLEKFEAAYAYYELIAKKNKIKTGPLNKRVIEAYWIGNELLDKVTADDLRQMIIDKFTKPGLLSKEKAAALAKQIPDSAKPHHSFHVLILGSITGRVNFTGDTKLKDICRIGWGRVTRIVIPACASPMASARRAKAGVQTKKAGFRVKHGMTNTAKIIVKYNPLVGKKFLQFGKARDKEIFWDKEILPETKTGDWVSFHWNYAIQILREIDIINLFKYTKNTLDTLNKNYGR